MNIMGVERVAFSVFGIDIYWYGVIISLAILVAYVLSFLLVKIRKLDSNFNFEILISILPLGIIFARLFAVLFDSGLSIADFFEFRSGGMSIIGAIVGGLLGLVILRLVKKRSILESADLLVVVLILAQGIGRWGNYFNSEIYGNLITDPAWQFFPFAVEVNGAFFEALFFYEFVLDVLGFVGLFILYKKVKIRGVVTAGYLMFYGVIRSILEPRRNSKFILMIGNIPFSLAMSVIMIVAGAVLLLVVLVKYFKKKRLEKTNG
ncbi:MAG: prolipoprotein diacylglyceryl transferase [Clostridia bacterium]|nr:prolipoprotein diacylglyceryl transferase [Clostridia bacterium]